MTPGVMGKVLAGGGWTWSGASSEGAECTINCCVISSFDNDSLMLVFRAYFDSRVFFGCEK